MLIKHLRTIIILTIIIFPMIITAQSDDPLYKKAVELSEKFLIIDTHIDVPYRMKEKWDDISKRTKGGHFDYVRAKAGGLNAPFMSIYIPARYQKSGGAKALADSLIDMVKSFENKWPDKFSVAKSTDDVYKQFKKGLVSLPMGMENGAGIENDIANLKHFYDRGIRYITLTHSLNNLICDSSYDTTKTWHGLSPFGKKVVEEMNRLGIIVDISHVSDDTFYQVMLISKAPAIASHSSCRIYTPGWERNMSDDMIKRLAENDGVIQITFGSYFVNTDYFRKSEEIRHYLTDHNINRNSKEGQLFIEKYKKANGFTRGTIKDIVKNINHVVELVGIDHVGLGSDFDGVSSVPEGMDDVSFYPNLIYHLLKQGYSENDIQKICSGNILRVWKKVEDISKELQKKS